MTASSAVGIHCVMIATDPAFSAMFVTFAASPALCSAGASGFVVPDLLASVYADGHYDRKVTDELGIRFDAQLTHQHTVGQELLAGSPFDTWNIGLRSSASWRIATAALDASRR